MKKGTLDLALRDLSAVINRQSDHVESLYSRGKTNSLHADIVRSRHFH